MRIASVALTVVVLAAACGGAATAPSPSPTPKPTPEPTVAIADSSLGKILVGFANKMTLYMYAKDSADLSTCYDQCANNWPAFTISGDPIPAVGMVGKLSVSTRKDGQKQLQYNGKPLYFYNKDTKPGDVLGNSVGQVWSVVTNP